MTCKEILFFFKDKKNDSEKIIFEYEDYYKTCYFKFKVNTVKFDTFSCDLDEKLKLFVNVESSSKEEAITIAELKKLAKKCCKMAGDNSYIIFTSHTTKPRLGSCYITKINNHSGVRCEIADYDSDVMERE